ncbi:MAG: PAS domain-containing protein [Planctomycetes bacterium]|nr:PAS domain-containing protein [Planctomycetota bacterium]
MESRSQHPAELEPALAALGIGVFSSRGSAGLVEADARVRDWLGLPASGAPLARDEFLAPFAPESREALRAALAHARGDAGCLQLQLRVATLAPRWLHVRLHASSEPEDGVAGACTDDSARHAELEHLRARLSSSEAVVRSASAILVAVDSEYRVTIWNAEASRVFERSETHAIGRHIRESCGSAGEGLVLGLRQAFQQQSAVRVPELALAGSDGKERFLGLTINPVIADDGWRCVVFGRDITEQKLLDLQFAHALKLESIGQLAAGIAHEINTPTQFVGDNLRFLRDSFVELAPLLDAVRAAGDVGQAASRVDLEYLVQEIPRALEESLAGVGRVAKIVGAMKEFSHPSTGEKVLVDLNRNIESTITVARNEWKYVATLQLDLCPTLPHVPCLPDEMNQVVLNLVINAAHAIAERYGANSGRLGEIRVATALVGEWIELRIGDDGAGIPEAIRSRIFDPFFTTKGVGKGTGQGLAIARSVVVDKHSGTITVESVRGQGTTFIVRIPLVPAQKAAA